MNLDRLYLKEIPLSRLRLLAEFAGFEKTPRWHARLGKVLREAKYVDAAIKEFLIAIRMDEQYWGAKDGLALCYGELKEFALAIEWEQKALALVPKEDEDMKGSCWQDICRWRLEINDVDGAIKASKEAYSLDPEDPSAMNWHITTLEAGSRLEEMLEFVEGLERKNSPTTGESLLTELLSTATDVHDKIAHAARALGRLDFVLNGIETAIAGAERKEDAESLATLRYHLATFKFRHTDNKEEAMDMWEYVLESTAERKNAWDFWFSRTYSSDQLSQLYFGEAIAAEKAGARPDYWISKLERLSKQDKGLNSERDVYSTKNASLILGLWYRLHGQVDEAHACFRAKVLEGIDILTDDDPNNDMWGYSTLAETLLIAGDKENAAAAFAITNAPLDKLKASRRAEQTRKEQARGGSNGWNNAEEEGLQIAARLESESNSSPKGPSTDPVVNNEGTEAITEKAAATPEDSLADRSKVDDAPVEIEANEGNPSDDISSYFMWSCDGQCKRKVEDWTALYFCEHCLSTCFCDQCIELVKTKKLPFRKCDPEHPFYQVYPVGEKMEEIAAVKVDGKIMPHTEWLEKLRKTWAE